MIKSGSGSCFMILCSNVKYVLFYKKYLTAISLCLPAIFTDDPRQCCGSGMFIPDPNFFHPGSRILDPEGQKGTGPGSGSATLIRELDVFLSREIRE